MGNSGSSGHNQQGHHRPRHSGHGNGYGMHLPAKWSHSLDTPEQRNRMKSGYFPGHRGYIHVQHPGLQPPHKVLPTVSVNPGKALKPTSNGAILHGGGTISGRKLLNELDPTSAEAESLRRAIRKRSTASCPNEPGGGDISGISTPNLSSMEYNSPVHGDYFKKKGSGGGSSKGGSSSRDYDSEPDLREVGLALADREVSPDRSVSPLPNTFTLISESPAKKQIRSRKKSKAPLPPNEQGKSANGHLGSHQDGDRDNGMNESHGKKRLHRIFKTKADIKSSKQEQQKNSAVDRGGAMRASIESERSQRLAMLARESRNRHSEVGRTISSSSTSKSQSIETETTALASNGVSKSSESNNILLKKKKNVKATTSAPLCSTKEEQDNNNEAARNLKRGVQVHALPLSREAPSGRHRQVPKKTLTSSRTATPEPSISTSTTSNLSRRLVQSSDKLNSPSPSDSSNTNGLVDHSNSNSNSNNNISSNSNRSSSRNSNAPTTSVPASTKKTFYFGMDMGNFPKAKLINSNHNSNSELLNKNGEGNHKNAAASSSSNGHTNSASATGAATSSATTSSSIKENEKAKHEETPNSNVKSESKISRRKLMRDVDEFAYKMGQRSAHSQPLQQSQPPPISNGIVGKKHSVDSTVAMEALQSQQRHSSSNGHLSHRLNANNTESSQALHSQQSPSPRLPNNVTKGKVQQSSHINGNISAKLVNSHRLHGKLSECDSDGLHRRQDSGSFDIEEDQGRTTRVQKKESSSDLSSSDLDIPLLLRPTLPQRRPDLPRFSPTAAWRALDSPRASGRSLSSEEGFHFEDRIQRYTRPMAPPRNSHERSGDSGISAGDGGSPANPLPEIIASNRHNNILHTTNSSSSSNNNNHLPNNKIISKLRKQNSHGELGKCWTPEQDLDESSSEFEHDAVPIPILSAKIGGGSVTGSCSSRVGLGVPPGLRTPPKFTTRGHLFDKHGSAVVVSDSDSKYYNGNSAGEDNANKRHLYARSSKVKQVVSQGSNGKLIESKKVVHQSKLKESNAITPSLKRIAMIKSRQNPGKYSNESSNSSNQFRGLDTNWFLSRSEPNSLNVLPVEEPSRRMSSEPFQPEFLHKVFPPQMLGRGSRRLAHQRQRQVRKQTEDLFLDEQEHDAFVDIDQEFEGDESEEEEDILVAHEVRSEIGYGPSSMNFYVSPSSPTHPYVNRGYNHTAYDEDQGNYYGEQETNSLNLHRNKTSAGISSRRPFSHIMYLPAYDSRRIHHYNPHQYNRRAKSVDHLDTSELSIFRINGGDDFFESDNEVKQQHRKILGSNANNGVGSQFQRQFHLRSRSVEKKSHPVKSTNSNTNHNNNEKSVSVSRGRSSSPFARSQSVPLYTASNQLSPGCDVDIDGGDCDEDQQQKVASGDANPTSNNNNNKKKFKFQSTLRVLERKIIEKQLAREAEEREMERLREMEAMKKVEEEFQKKRAKEKQEIQNQLRLANVNTGNGNISHVNPNNNINNNMNLLKPKSGASIISNSSQSQKSSTTPNSVTTSAISMSTCATPSSRSSSSIANHNPSSSNQINHVNIKKQSNHNNRQRVVSSHLRQEPEGAPAFSTTTDLRKELIQASRKRSGHGNSNKGIGNGNSNGSSEPLTQELSEYRQEVRQYCDYRRSPRHQSSNSARFAESSSSDIFPISRRTPTDRASNKSNSRYYRSTVHPEVVCDIPGKPFPYMVNFSRLSGSNSNIVSSVIEERPGSGMASGPSSVISDNYRRDWAHHRGSAGSTHGGPIPGRASSVASLHSAPGYTPDHLRHSSTDLTGHGGAVDSPRIRHKRKSPLYHKYSNSPPASPLPPISAMSSNDSNATDPEKGSSVNKGPTSSTSVSTTTSTAAFQLKPFNKVKGYRPVAFKPPAQNYMKLASTTVN